MLIKHLIGNIDWSIHPGIPRRRDGHDADVRSSREQQVSESGTLTCPLFIGVCTLTHGISGNHGRVDA